MSDAFAERIERVVGAGHVVVDPGLAASYEQDWSRRFSGRARLVVRPGSTEEVAAVLRLCAEAKASVVAQGGNTGLVGGSVPRGGEVVLSLVRLDEVGEVDGLAAQMTVGAGTRLASAQAHAREAGLEVAIDHGARDSATVGGAVSTDAGGIHAFRYGTTRTSVAGLEAVLADGTVLTRLNGLLKDNAGYNLPALLVGSEGTLAVVTRVRLRLIPHQPRRATALVAVADTDTAVRMLAELRPALPSLEAIELFYRDGLALVCDELGRPRPFPTDYPAYVLVECAAREDPIDELGPALDATGAVLDAVAAVDDADRRALWELRELHPEAIATQGIAHKLDISLPLPALARFESESRIRVAEAFPGARTLMFGHLADGNFHVSVLGPDPADEAVDELVLRFVAELGGSVSAEHGIGVAKRRWLSLTRSESEIAAMRAIKTALDPAGILNPGVLL
jgi:FAD/FMN-containing dehydrogenase